MKPDEMRIGKPYIVTKGSAPERTDVKFTAEQIEEIRYGIGGTREGAEQVIQEVAQMIAAKIEGMYTDEDLTDCEPTAVALASLVEQLKATNEPS